jgi:glycosyltransferase involved in cell wall biosynthesis
VNEVMNAARPVIVSDDVGSGPDLVDDGVNGCIYPVGDVDALTKALRRVLETPGAAAAMGRKAYERIQSWSFEQDVAGLRRAIAAVVPGFEA